MQETKVRVWAPTNVEADNQSSRLDASELRCWESESTEQEPTKERKTRACDRNDEKSGGALQGNWRASGEERHWRRVTEAKRAEARVELPRCAILQSVESPSKHSAVRCRGEGPPWRPPTPRRNKNIARN